MCIEAEIAVSEGRINLSEGHSTLTYLFGENREQAIARANNYLQVESTNFNNVLNIAESATMLDSFQSIKSNGLKLESDISYSSVERVFNDFEYALARANMRSGESRDRKKEEIKEDYFIKNNARIARLLPDSHDSEQVYSDLLSQLSLRYLPVLDRATLIEDLIEELSCRPVGLRINSRYLGFSSSEISGHVVVLTGVNREEGIFQVRDSADYIKTISFNDVLYNSTHYFFLRYANNNACLEL